MTFFFTSQMAYGYIYNKITKTIFTAQNKVGC